MSPQESMDRPNGVPELVARALESMDGDSAERARAGFHEAVRRPVTLRANTLKATSDEVSSSLTDAGMSFERVAWYDDAFIIEPNVRERALWDLPIYREGGVYLQSLSSMMPPLLLGPRPGADVLDMCAAPGGKTSQMAALAGGSAHLTACEMSAPRAEKLSYNLGKLGARNVNVMRIDARRLDEFFSFDQILLDAPCTGTGTYRMGDARAIKRMTSTLLSKTVRSQRALLDRALTVLKPGGTLVYSTCSILPQENDEQVAAALKRHRDCKLVSLASESNGIEGSRSQKEPAAQDGSGEPLQLPETARSLIDAVETGAVPVLEGTLTETLTVCPSRLYEGFYMAFIRKGC